ncbi:TetR/AcrR family transcriptional regulator [Herbiconiux daphne]|uniref:TetR/AcrR family transcriptional regulator n=1 Tax=Herbiconiux daphne TaxID=2970914 RepID=A0ABT2GZQ0_9MICO|nr:TetR/AcrR family transcriptional regulator [Herbiconiux daphne]MCS5733430.1 TetR/AcrR family transcriptional regulator [Herbiconiux daphne]
MDDSSTPRGDNRAKIIDVAARLLQEQGPAGVTTRGVAQGAGVQAPTIYRLFGDKDGLLESVAEHVMANYVSAKAAVVAAASADGVDPLDDMRGGWRSQVDFGIANPALFRLLSDPDRVNGSPAAESGRRVLEARVHRLALAGRLRVSEQRAVAMIQAAGTGAIQTLLSTQLATAVAFRAVTPHLEALSAAERRMLTEWVDRAIDDAQRSAADRQSGDRSDDASPRPQE